MTKLKPNLAERMRPKFIADIVGQEHLTNPDKIIGRIVKAQRPISLILYARPGVGKTSIANALANDLGMDFEQFNASVDDKKKLKSITDKSEKEPLVLLLDEIHRLDKPKQDHLLPYLEKGHITLIGATTENPYINVNPALRSRTTILELKPVDFDSMTKVIHKAINFLQDEIDNKIIISDEQIAFLASSTDGDVRSALNALELVTMSSEPDKNGIKIDTDALEQVLNKKAIAGDKNGDEHYNLLSAFQKSIRGSDINASLHYLARLIAIGDLQSICRRLSIIAYEDIGIANTPAVINAQLAIQVAEKTGLPEARIALSSAVIELASSKKTNIAEKAIDLALADLDVFNTTIPMHLRDTHFKGAAALGHTGYIYPHDYKNHYIQQQYMPDELVGHNYIIDENPIDEHIERVVKFAKRKSDSDLNNLKN
jgi:crossover junction endodeoxyribonuclease